MVELHHCAKVRRNRSNYRGRDMAIFRFLQDGGRPAVRHLGFVMHVLAPHDGHLVVFITVQNVVGIDAVVLIISRFPISRVWLETPIYAKKCFFGVGFDPLNGKPYERNPKSHITAQVRVI